MFFGGIKFVGETLNVFGNKKCSRDPLLIFLSKLFPGETLCKFTQIFPPKDLVYIGRKKNCHTFNYLNDFHLINLFK